MTLEFERSYILFLLFIPILLIVLRTLSRKSFHPLFTVSHPFFSKKRIVYFNPEIVSKSFLYLSFMLFVISASGPYIKNEYKRTIDGEGISIVLAIDISASMLARDFKPDRLEATKKVASEFVLNRPDDYIGIVLYAGESFTKIPLTNDKKSVLQAIEEITYGSVDDGTAIGMGLATAVNRIRNSNTKSNVIILMSDGENNMGEIDPITAGELAAKFGIKVYTIGVGTKGYALTPVAYDFAGNLIFENRQVSIDEDLLKKIAITTGGKYFRATDANTLKNIYDEINILEKSKITEIKYDSKKEYYHYFLYAGICLFIFDWLLKLIVFNNVFE